jgi:PAS domain S-box-containing protein
MNVYPWLLLLSSIVSVSLGISVYFLNRKAWINRLFALLTFFSAYWAFTEFMMRQSSTVAEANLWNKASFPWPFMIATLLQFSLVFTDNRWAKRRLSSLLIYSPALFFSFIELTTNLISGPAVANIWGYVYTNPTNSVLFIISLGWASGLAFLSFFLCVRYCYRSKDKYRRAQAKFVTFGLLIPIVAYIWTDVVNPFFGVNIPDFGNVSAMFCDVFVAYAVLKYELFSLNPALAADKIIDTMPDSLILADIKGKILQVNQSLVNSFGYSQKDLVGKSITSLFESPAEGESVLAALAKNRTIKISEHKFVTGSGEVRFVTFSGSAVSSSRGQDLGFTCVIHDLTPLKQIQDKLIKSERLASIGELARQVGHDLRNPLSAIKNGAYYLRKKGAACSDADRNSMLHTIDSAVEDSNRIINDLLEYSSELRLDLRKCSFHSIISKVLSNINVPTNVEVVNDSEDCLFMADDLKLERAFSIIVKNAFDAMPKGGTLKIRCFRDGLAVKFQFTDSGVGMTDEVLSRIFSPLSTTKAKGMGFSLAICKRIVEAHGGGVAVESRVNVGTTFTITLPVKPESDSQINSGWLVMPQEA